MTKLNALQNMANHANPRIKVYPHRTADQRRTVEKFFAQIDSETISPVLDYTGLNCFLMGYAKATTP